MRLVIIGILTFFLSATQAQNPQGTFLDNSDFIKLENGFAKFSVYSNGGIIVKKVGEGQYKFIDNYLVIYTKEFSGEKSIVKPTNGQSDKVVFQITDIKGKEIPYANILLLDKKGKEVGGIISNDQGLSFYNRNLNIFKVRVSLIGYDDLTFAFDPGNDYSIKLADYDVIENSTVVFKVIKMDNEVLELILLSMDFKPNKSLTRDLKRLDKRIMKFHESIRIYKK
jgi:hypothetical protein